jgi:hypothetical protein
LWAGPAIKNPIQIECRADQAQMREGLREVAQRFAANAGFFGVQPKVISLLQHFLKEHPSLAEASGVRSSCPR